MGTSGIACGAHVADGRSTVNSHAAANRDPTIHQMGIKRKVTVSVADHDNVAITAARPTGVDDYAIIRRKNGITSDSIVIKPVVYWWVVFIPTECACFVWQLEISSAGEPGGRITGIRAE